MATPEQLLLALLMGQGGGQSSLSGATPQAAAQPMQQPRQQPSGPSPLKAIPPLLGMGAKLGNTLAPGSGIGPSLGLLGGLGNLGAGVASGNPGQIAGGVIGSGMNAANLFAPDLLKNIPGIGAITAGLGAIPGLIGSLMNPNMSGGEKAVSMMGSGAQTALPFLANAVSPMFLAAAPLIQGGLGAIMQQMQPSAAWRSFGQRTGETQQALDAGINALAEGLTKVKSQEELSGLLNTFKTYVRGGHGDPTGGMATNSPEYMEWMKSNPMWNPTGGVPGYGEGKDLYDLSGLPGATGSKHEGGFKYSYDPQTEALNAYIAQLAGTLPGQRTGDVLSGDALKNLWGQYLAPSPIISNAQAYLAAEPAFGSYGGTDVGYTQPPSGPVPMVPEMGAP